MQHVLSPHPRPPTPTQCETCTTVENLKETKLWNYAEFQVFKKVDNSPLSSEANDENFSAFLHA